MISRTLRIATRKSPLALWQAEFVKDQLKRHYPELEVELVTFTTRGDKILDTPLAKVGGKGLFVKELEVAMLEGQADLAVHSMKDVPMEFPEGLGLAVICEREDPRDALVSNTFSHFDELPEGARVGTCSLRRQCQIKARRPDLSILDLRGNVNTRLAKLDAGEFDAIILAAAGLKRLGFEGRIASYLEPEQSLPAVGQGAIGIECRLEDTQTLQWLAALNHRPTQARVTAERAMNIRLQGGCQVPIAGYALLENEQLWLRGLVGRPDGEKIISDEVRGAASEAQALGERLAERLLEAGASDILTELYGQNPA